MRSRLTSSVLAGSGTVELFDYELDALREIADVQILHVAEVDEGGVTEHLYTVHYVIRHPAVHPYLPPHHQPIVDSDR
jgi:hypothetical protein